jgi:hypothetical protein
MTLVSDANIIDIQITSPLMNLVGFEYQAKTPAENKAIAEMSEVFDKPQDWLTFHDSYCQLTQHDVNFTDQDHTDHEDDHHQHDHQVGQTQHAELEASYQFSCDEGELNALTISLNHYFKGIESIAVSWIVDEQSGITTIHHREQKIVFNSH